MKILYLDCASGISGDMFLGAMIGAGLSVDALEAELRKLPLKGWTLKVGEVRRGALTATRAEFEIEETHHHRTWKTIRAMIETSDLRPEVRDRALAIFSRLAEAEAAAHGVALDDVHFHEVGALDSILDIVGAATALDALAIEQVVCSPVNVGHGTVSTQHGQLPVPAPATASMLVGVPVYGGDIEAEMTTPTGAAIIAACASSFGSLPPMTVSAIGAGAGQRDHESRPNVLRVFLGEAAATHRAASDRVSVLEANLDDMSPQVAGHVLDTLLAAGALDVFFTPVQMKKNRPGMLLTVLCEPVRVDAFARIVFEQTTTIGLRISEVGRRVLAREIVPVETPHGTVRMKLSRLNGSVLNAAPEYEDCLRLAQERSVPLKQVMADAEFAYRRGRED